MKLYTSDSNELMNVSAITPEGSNLIVTGTIMGAMPIQAVLTPSELRKSFKLLSIGTVFSVIKMLFSR
jgi:hypothetical protein